MTSPSTETIQRASAKSAIAAYVGRDRAGAVDTGPVVELSTKAARLAMKQREADKRAERARWVSAGGSVPMPR